MSKRIGYELPPEVVRTFDGENLEEKIGLGFLLVTRDDDGAPRPCLLSAGEMLATGSRAIRLGLWPGTRTARNLSQGEVILLCSVVSDSALYIRGRPYPLRSLSEAGLQSFEIEINSIETDVHEGMPVTSGITFSVETEPKEVVDTWAAQIAALREARREGSA